MILNSGKVDALGKHDELLKKSALYQNLTNKYNLTETFLIYKRVFFDILLQIYL